jgi:hypothetical protein
MSVGREFIRRIIQKALDLTNSWSKAQPGRYVVLAPSFIGV